MVESLANNYGRDERSMVRAAVITLALMLIAGVLIGNALSPGAVTEVRPSFQSKEYDLQFHVEQPLDLNYVVDHGPNCNSIGNMPIYSKTSPTGPGYLVGYAACSERDTSHGACKDGRSCSRSMPMQITFAGDG